MNNERLRLKLYGVLFGTILIIGSMGFVFFEGLSPMDSIYFSIVTMATVGYGDIHPMTPVGKVLTLVLIVGGVGTFLGVVASITDLFLGKREEDFRQQKTNMVMSLFFSELGSELLRHCVRVDPAPEALSNLLALKDSWTPADFSHAESRVRAHAFGAELTRGYLSDIHTLLSKRASLLLNMMENPILLEHGRFTELLRAVFHLRDELMHRPDIATFPDSDRKHLEGDIVRIYKLLTLEWLNHMVYLKNNYGYLLSLAIRTNPFDPDASAVVQ